ncbi:MAG: septum formation initiator family protein [Hahellaceae bacterium]|nr:septum formation initiator family protein [Hahellaceae bacterium]MCP5213182.1 septum formation initiator family protein [Hahellaceae bacterium]
MQWVWALMGVFIISLQFRIWAGEGSFGQMKALQQQIDAQLAENHQLADRNSKLMAEVMDLKTGLQAVEEKARNQLGMVGSGETFFWVVSE